MNTKIKYEFSDAWLLLSIIYASRSGEADIQRIVEAGARINNAILSKAELNSGLSRLTRGGHIKEHGGVVAPARKVIKAYLQRTTPGRSIRRELDDMEQFLAVSDRSPAKRE